MNTGERLKGERIRLGYSVRKFAEAAGVVLSTQQRYESGERTPDATYLNRISELGAEIFWIMRGTKEDDEMREKRMSPYSPELRQLIEDYGKCPSEVQAALRTMASHAAQKKKETVDAFKKKHGSVAVTVEG